MRTCDHGACTSPGVMRAQTARPNGEPYTLMACGTPHALAKNKILKQDLVWKDIYNSQEYQVREKAQASGLPANIEKKDLMEGLW